MLQLFSSIYAQDRQLLSDAYEAACDELQNDYHLSGNELGILVDPLVGQKQTLQTWAGIGQDCLVPVIRCETPFKRIATSHFV
jgi:hypothetical protein